MSPTSLHTFYQEKIADYTSRIRTLQQRMAGVSWLRLVVFACLVLTTYQLIQKSFPAGLWGVDLILLLAFIVLIGIAQRFKDRKALLEKLCYVNTNEWNILHEEPNGFGEGKEYLEQEGYLDDLDIFGPHSLFHLLNRTTTFLGKEKLAGLLKKPLQSPGKIKDFQEAIRVLSGQVHPRQLLTAQGLLNLEKEGNLYSIGDWLQSPVRLTRKKWVQSIRWILVILNSGSLLLWALTGNYRPLILGVMAGWILTGIFAKYRREQSLLLGKKQSVFEQYASILGVFYSIDTGESLYLKELQHSSKKAYIAMRKLATLSSYFDQQMNLLVNFLLNNFFLYNLWCLIALEKWKEAHQDLFPEWIETVGNIESLNSLAAFAFNNPNFTYPDPVDNATPFIGAVQMAHPLIPEKDRVPNDFSLGKKERLILVTGSNMSGKTTFLRTTGVNLLLAQCGAPVCAASFLFTPMQILSSLRVSDSLQEHTSYFMAELKKLRLIIDRLQEGQASLVLVDEILRGTNSEDKTHGSEKFIQKLLQFNCLSLFATHDLSLSAMETDAGGGVSGSISNYCFESVIEEGELHFNYLLQRGVARNRNASFLMEKMGII